MRSRQHRLLYGSITLVICLVLFTTFASAKTKLTYWHAWGGHWGEKHNEIVDHFNSIQDEIEVEVVQIPGEQIVQKLMTASLAGTAPDAVTIWSGMDPIVMDDYFISLDGYMSKESDLDYDQWLPGMLEYNSYGGTLYGLPWAGNSLALYYNKDIFRETGLDPEAPPKTWNELDAVAAKTTKRGERGYERLGFIPWGFEHRTLCVYGWQLGADVWNEAEQKVNMTDPRIIEAAEWNKSYADTYGIEQILELQAVTDVDPFAAGRYTMHVSGAWEIFSHREYGPDVDFGVALIPYPEGGQPASLAFTDSMFIPVGSKQQDAAWKFLKWMATEGNYMWSRKFGEFVPRWDQTDAPEFADPLFQMFFKAGEYNRSIDIPVRTFFADKLTGAMEMVLHGKMTVKEAMQKVEKEVQTEFDRQKRHR